MMSHPEYRDESRVVHMHTYLERVAAILPSLTETEMEDGEPRTERVLYNLTLLGEAANNVSREYAAAHADSRQTKDGQPTRRQVYATCVSSFV